ncbi:hypothetical protein [Desulfosoma sp.]
MTTVMPEGEAIRKAVKWVSSCVQESPDKPVQKIVHEAILRFDLSPIEAQFLMDFYSAKGRAED